MSVHMNLTTALYNVMSLKPIFTKANHHCKVIITVSSFLILTLSSLISNVNVIMK